MLLRYLPSFSQRLSVSHIRPRCLQSINHSYQSLVIKTPVRSFAGVTLGDEHTDDQYHEMMEGPEDDEFDEAELEKMAEEEENELDALDGRPGSHRAQKGSKLDRLKQIEKTKRQAKLALRARITKLEKVKPGGKARKPEDDVDTAIEEEVEEEDDYEEEEGDVDFSEEVEAERRQSIKEGSHIVNDRIVGDPILMIDGNGKRIGLVGRSAALAKVRSAGLDLLLLSPPNVTPPVCKVVRYREWLEAEQLKVSTHEADLTKKTKTLMIRKTIAPHDLQTKMNQAKRFLRHGHPVKITYLELNPTPEEWVPFFEGIAKHLEGVGTSNDITSRPFAIFHIVRNTNSRTKTEKQKKGKAETKSAEMEQ